jgi:hypothetical protein
MNYSSLGNKVVLFSVFLAAVLGGGALVARAENINEDEGKVPPYVLPDVLQMRDGREVATRQMWEKKRRPEILRLFEEQMYGVSPKKVPGLVFGKPVIDSNALGGLAIRKEVTIQLTKFPEGPEIHLLMYLPKGTKERPPVFLGLNFEGNQTVSADSGISLNERWVRADKTGPWVKGLPSESTRGKDANSWQVEKILQRGYALATFHYWDVEPDDADGFEHSIRATLPKPHANKPKPDEWGAIAAWAWGVSRAMDYLQTDPDIQPSKVALMGHSRLGKTALWAGAQDRRFAIVISNNSGEGGAALSRRWFGETVVRINTVFPHWFCGNYKQYSNHVEKLPMDQHMLIALMAPRPVYVASAEQDRWADPKGEFLSALNAEPVYHLYGLEGLGVKEMPGIEQPVGNFIGYHIRHGKHDVTAYDWDRYLDFADRHFGKPAGH